MHRWHLKKKNPDYILFVYKYINKMSISLFDRCLSILVSPDYIHVYRTEFYKQKMNQFLSRSSMTQTIQFKCVSYDRLLLNTCTVCTLLTRTMRYSKLILTSYKEKILQTQDNSSKLKMVIKYKRFFFFFKFQMG